MVKFLPVALIVPRRHVQGQQVVVSALYSTNRWRRFSTPTVAQLSLRAGSALLMRCRCAETLLVYCVCPVVTFTVDSSRRHSRNKTRLLTTKTIPNGFVVQWHKVNKNHSFRSLYQQILNTAVKQFVVSICWLFCSPAHVSCRGWLARVVLLHNICDVLTKAFKCVLQECGLACSTVEQPINHQQWRQWLEVTTRADHPQSQHSHHVMDASCKGHWA